MTLPYFLSTQETGFELSMLKKFDAELLIGQLSYKQKADIYNLTKGFDHTKKQCSTSETEKSDKSTTSAQVILVLLLYNFVSNHVVKC